jgi:membrane dipeptidase
MKKSILFALVFPAIVLTGCGTSTLLRDRAEEAAALHRTMVTIDTHDDTPLAIVRKGIDVGMRHDPAQDEVKVDFPRMKEGGLDAAFFIAWIPQGPRTAEGNRKADSAVTAIIDTIHAVVARNTGAAALALTSADAARIKAEGKSAVYIGVENGYAIGDSLALIKKFYRLGARYMTLCHTKNDDICDSSSDPDTVRSNGLSAFGKSVVGAMNDIGMIVDVSHISDKSFYDVIAVSKTPVVATHSNARAVCPHDRNMTDDMITTLAKHGGVIQVSFVSEFVKLPVGNPGRDSAMNVLRQKYAHFDHPDSAQQRAMRRERRELERRFPQVLPTVADLVGHIDHIVKIAGIDHVGIGSDFDGGGEILGCSDVSMMKNITAELLTRGYSHEDCAKIWGGNFLRVFRQVEEFAHAGRN